MDTREPYQEHMKPLSIHDQWAAAAQVGCRPLNLMRAFGRLYPGIWQALDAERAKHRWPKWCFMPHRDFHVCLAAHVARAGGDSAALPDGVFENEVAAGTALSAWRQSKGVYVFERELAESLERTELTTMPTEVVMRMPEHCVYVAADLHLPADGECPALQAHGFFAHVTLGGDHQRLLMVVDSSFGAIGLAIGLEPGIDLIASALKESIHPDEQETPEVRRRLAALLRWVLPYLLYLCAEEPDIDGTPRGAVEPTKTRHGTRWFPPEDVATWKVGVRLGAVLRKAREEQEREETGEHPHGRPRPHLRRAHFHHYWTGPKGQRRLVLRWVHQALVNAKGPDDLVATVRPVEP